jgi:ribonucleoside-triphosphate reductase
MVIYKVRKRNGSIVSFEIDKIEKAIRRAIEAVGGTDFSQVSEMAKKVGDEVERKIGHDIPDVETIQDAVEQILIKE